MDLTVPLLPSLPGTALEQIGAAVGSVVLAPFTYAVAQMGLALGLTGSLVAVEMSVGGIDSVVSGGY